MYQISTNWCLNQLRNHKGRARKHADHKDEIQPEEAPTLDPVGALDAATLRELVAECDPETQRIVVHLYFDDLTREETGRLVGISQPTLRKRHDAFVQHARRALGVVLSGLFALFVIHSLVSP